MKKEQKNNLEEEMTIVGQQAKSMPEARKSGVWKSIIIGGVPGVILGTAGTALAQEVIDTNHQEAQEEEEISDTNIDHNVPQVTGVDMAESVNDDMSFGEAFAAAREEVGPGGVFEWHGNLYSTYTSEEWEAMSNEDRQEFANNVAGSQVNDDNHEDSGHEQTSEGIDNGEDGGHEPASNENVSGEESGNEEIEVQIHEVGSIANDEGEIMNVAVATVDGHDAAFIDVDNDGYVDGVVVDANDNGVIEDNEVIDTPDSELNMSYLAMVAEGPEDSLYEGTPDYTNDADTSSLA